MSTPTTATGGSDAGGADLKTRAADLWRDAIAGHPNENALLRGDVLGRMLEPAVEAWQHAPAGDPQILAAAAVRWRFGIQHNVQAGIERAAAASVADDLRQARDRIAGRPAGFTALASAARQAGLDPAHPDYDLQLHALADALALSGVDLAGVERQQQRDLTHLAQIATDVARSAGMPPVPLDAPLPDRLAADVLAVDGAAGPAEPARRLFAAVGLGWQAGMVVGEDVGAVYAAHRIAATAAQDPTLRFGRMTPGKWAEHTLQPVKARMEQRLDPQAASLLWIDAAHAGSQVPSAAPGPAPPQDASRPRVSRAFAPLAGIDPAGTTPPPHPATPTSPPAQSHHRRR